MGKFCIPISVFEKTGGDYHGERFKNHQFSLRLSHKRIENDTSIDLAIIPLRIFYSHNP